MPNKIKNITLKDKIFDTFKYFFVILSFTGFIFSIYGIFLTKLNNHFYSFSALLTILAVFFGVSYLINDKKQKTTLQSELLSERFHDVCHTIRDEVIKLEKLASGSKLPPSDAKKLIENGAKNIIDELSEGLSRASNCTIASCIKIFDFCKNEEVKLDEMVLTTLTRSLNSGNKRKRHDSHPVPVLGNTDFEYIMKGIDDFFAVPDLEEYQKEAEYDNTNSSWSKHYKTTVVAPIRIEKKIINGSLNETEDYNIIGFLCVDSKSTEAFKMPFGPLGLEFVKAIADVLYIYLEKGKSYYLECIANSQGVA